MRKPKVEMITLAEMAALAGVSKPAATNFIHRQEAAGLSLATTAGRRTKMVNRNHPVIAAYIQNQTRQPGNRGGGAPLSEAALEKLKAQTEKTELGAGVLRARYIDRDSALKYLDKLLEAERKELSAMIDRVLKRLDREFGPLPGEQTAEVKWILEQPASDALEMSRKEIERFRDDTRPRTGNPEPAPAPKGKYGKNNPLSRKR